MKWLFMIIAATAPISGTAKAIVVPTSFGNGADTYLTNDDNRGPGLAHGTKTQMEIRQLADTRLRILYLRFDLSGVTGDLSDATITLNSITVDQDRPIVFHGLNENPTVGSGESWKESTISYSTASGLDPNAAVASFALTADATAGVLAASAGSAVGPVTTDTSTSLDSFLAADTNQLVTFIAFIDPSAVTGSEYFFFSTKEGGGAPILTFPHATAVGDTDADGLPDLWEDLHFGNGDGVATLEELAMQAADGDPDGDGYSNLQEYTDSLDPNDPVSVPGANIIYVAPDGDDNGAGSFEDPFATVARAQTAATPGTTVYFRGGTYAISTGEIAEYSSVFARVFLMNKSGAEGSPIRYWTYPGETPVFDLSAVTPPDYRVYTFYVTGSWLHFKGLTVTGVQVTILTHTQSICFDNEGSHNIYEQLVMHDNQAIGMWIGNGSNSLVLNCDAYRNWDYTSETGNGGNVDGFGYHGRTGSTGNVFRGCRAWFNSDDGYDCITANEGVVFEHCWAFYNGYGTSFQSLGDGNGFKAGGYGSLTPDRLPNPIPRHAVIDCLAVKNKASGIYANHHPGGVDFIGNTSFRNGANYNMLCRLADNVTDVPGYGHILRNNLGHRGNSEVINVNLAACDSASNYYELLVTVSDADFESLDEALLTAPRQPGGELPVLPFTRLVDGSDLIDMGVALGVPFAETSPDLGCYETGMIETGNDGFELPVISLPATRPTGTVWDFTGNAGIKPDAQAPDGAQVAFIGDTGSMKQHLEGFVPGRNYQVHFLATGSATCAIQFGSAPPAAIQPDSGTFTSQDFEFTADSAAQSLELAVTGTGGEVRVDSIRITEITPTSDTDVDALADSWEFSHFAGLSQTAGGDADGDGTNNRVEQALALDPSSGSSAFRCTQGADGTLTWPGATDLNFIIQRSTGLVEWQDIETLGGTSGAMSFVDPDPPAGGAYYRIQLSLP